MNISRAKKVKKIITFDIIEAVITEAVKSPINITNNNPPILALMIISIKIIIIILS